MVITPEYLRSLSNQFTCQLCCQNSYNLIRILNNRFKEIPDKWYGESLWLLDKNRTVATDNFKFHIEKIVELLETKEWLHIEIINGSNCHLFVLFKIDDKYYVADSFSGVRNYSVYEFDPFCLIEFFENPTVETWVKIWDDYDDIIIKEKSELTYAYMD